MADPSDAALGALRDLAACVQALQDIIASPARAVHLAETALAKIMMRRMGVTAGAEGRVPVKIPALSGGDSVGWAMWVLRIDAKARGGFLFEGPFLKLGEPAPLPPGAVVLIASGGGAKRQVNRATAFVVQPSGDLAGNPQSATRACWDELASSIADYLDGRRAVPLLNPRVLPPMAPPPAAPAAAASSDPP